MYNYTEYYEYKSDSKYDFQNFSGFTAKVYDGPFDSMELLYDSSVSTEGNFSVTFSKSKAYLIEVYPSGNFNDYYELFEVRDCVPEIVEDEEETNVSTSDTEQNESSLDMEEPPSAISDEVFEYLEGNFSLNLVNTNASFSDIVVTRLSDDDYALPEFSSLSPQFSFRIEMRNGSMISFDEMDVDFQFNSSSNVSLLYYNESSESWSELNASFMNGKVTISSVDFGLYALVQRNQTNLTVENESLDVGSEQVDNASTSDDDELSLEETMSLPGNSPFLYGGIFAGVLLLLFFIFQFSKKKVRNIGPTQNEPPTDNHVEVLQAYGETYQKAKAYVHTYKSAYARDSLYRALRAGNVPDDVINTVFKEEY